MGERLDRVVDVATLVIGGCAVVVTGIVVAREVRPAPASPAGGNQMIEVLEDWEPLAEHAQQLGPENAPVTIIEFGDYECPFCKNAAPHLNAIMRQYAGKVRLVYRHLPLSGHSSAYPAARAAECAAEEGRFWSFHDALYAQSAWQFGNAFEHFQRMAEEAGVARLDDYGECLAREGPVPQISADQTVAADAGFTGTPTFLVNGHKYMGVIDSLEFADIYDEVSRQ